METSKLSKDELLKQLETINKAEKEIKDELFYQTFSNLTFLQTWKKCVNFRFIIWVIIFVELLMVFDFEHCKWIMLGFPIFLFMYSLTIPLENRQKIKFMKKNRQQ